ncbi:hypothetical protein Lal_00046388 [Lupinus albus]|nr:hypothetical protein Lal_00046388 [Lupinus albus]
MTRGNTCPLHPINPEIDRTYHRLVRQSRNLPFHTVADIDFDFVPVSMHSVQYTDFVHYVAFSDSEHSGHSENSVHSENMTQPPTPPSPRERTLRELTAPDFTYDSLCIQHQVFLVSNKLDQDAYVWYMGMKEASNINIGMEGTVI